MRYSKKRISLPEEFVVGAKVGVVGEGSDVFTITNIERDESGNVTDVHISSGCKEPLSKIYLLKNRSHGVAMEDPKSWIATAVGECDICKVQFPDSCLYYVNPDKISSMVCAACHKGGHEMLFGITC